MDDVATNGGTDEKRKPYEKKPSHMNILLP